MQNKNLHFVSVVVPSVNGNYAKLLLIDESVFTRLKKFTVINSKGKAKPYLMFVESNSLHRFLGNGGYLTKEQFAETLREYYNSIIVWKKNNKALKNSPTKVRDSI